MLNFIVKTIAIAAFGWAFAVALTPTVALATADDCPEGVVCLYNPLDPQGTGDSEAYDIRKIIGRVIRALLSIIGSIAFLMFTYGGVLWLTSAGNADRVKKGKDILIWSIAGLGIIFSAYAIVNAILNALTSGNVSGT